MRRSGRRVTRGSPLVLCLRRIAVVVALASMGACGDGNHGASPLPTPTVAPTACPERVTYSVVGTESDLDLGLTGNHFGVRFSDRGSVTLDLNCGNPAEEGCTECAVAGVTSSATAVDNRRCVGATEQRCAADSDCSSGSCAYFFGPPIPQAVGGVFVCLVYRVNEARGTMSPATGTNNLDLDALWSFFVPLAVDQPCPVCSGADVGSPGVCAGGDRDGLACTVHATDAVLGNTSFDCPPHAAAPLGDHNLAIGMTTGTASLHATEVCVDELFEGLAVLLSGSTPSQRMRRPNLHARRQ